ncbi:hypothetical protein [Chromatium okenii]|uniref:hypothetical protein n=1 Tax=Chromatium okenii TaxID=61644 RepID=UPI001F5B586B|nr:hypothetical protein [Chromatium okenii]
MLTGGGNGAGCGGAGAMAAGGAISSVGSVSALDLNHFLPNHGFLGAGSAAMAFSIAASVSAGSASAASALDLNHFLPNHESDSASLVQHLLALGESRRQRRNQALCLFF